MDQNLFILLLGFAIVGCTIVFQGVFMFSIGETAILIVVGAVFALVKRLGSVRIDFKNNETVARDAS